MGLAYPGGVLGTRLLHKGQSVGRLITISAVGGVLAAAIALPAVGTIGIVTRNAANKFEAMSTQALGEVPQRSQILDSQGHVLATIYNVNASYYYGPGNVKPLRFDGIDRVPVSYDHIAPVMRNAIIAIEDSRYYQHGAIDFRGTVRALVNDLEHKPVQGGSTIAQQYVKNVLILTAKDPAQAEGATRETISRKIHELRLAIAVEHQMSRNQILAGYLNDAYFGNLAVGVQVAARTYFGTSAKDLTLTQAALLAGLVENPTAYNPIAHPGTAKERRNTVLARMQQLHMISAATAAAAERKHLHLHVTPEQNGCSSSSARSAAFFCDYAVQAVLRDTRLGKTPRDRAKLLATGGLKIYTTLSPQDQRAANNAVNGTLPPRSHAFNPGHLADAEALIQPGTGRIRAIAEDRGYGNGPGLTTIDYAATTPYDGGVGVQTGSSSKLFTLITALEQNVPFGFTLTVPNSATDSGYTNCDGQPAGVSPAGPGTWQVSNASKGDAGPQTLYTGTTVSVNTFYAALERQVGLCNVVKTAARLGMTWGNGSSLFQHYGSQPAADDIPSFTLGSANVAPMSMAAAYATVAARGIYCKPVAISEIVTASGQKLPAPEAGCHRVLSKTIADAVNYILQGVLTQPDATAANRGIGRPAAAKTGTAGSATSAPPSAAFAGYTPTLVGYVWVGGPTHTVLMSGYPNACYRTAGALNCPGSMFGDNAPGQTWQNTFLHAALGPPVGFVPVPSTSPLFRKGNGQSAPKPKPPPGHRPGPAPRGGGGGHHGHCPKRVPFCPPTG
jgi:membrane peptidoglycan carboxypeptidase